MKVEKGTEIRFSKFKENWQEYKLGEVYTERKEKGQDSLPILSVSIHKGISDGELDTGSLGKSVIRSEDKSLYKHVYPGDLVLNMMRAWQGAYGVVTSEGMVSPAYITAIPSNQIFPPFMDHCLRRDEMIAQINNLSYGVTDFRKRLYWKSFIKILCHIPSIPEQKRITSFLTKLDKSISIHEQELATLKHTKQGFLQKMFPKEGSSVPEIRFPGFTDDWEERKFKDFISKAGKKNTTDKNYPAYSVSNRLGLISQTEQFDGSRLDDLDKKSYKIVNPKEFAYNPARINVGSIAFNNLNKIVIVSSLYVVIKMSEELDNNFILQYIKSGFFINEVKRNSEGSVREYLFFESFKNINFPYTSNKEEQRKIGGFFKKLDETIMLYQQELDALQQTKKAFLQKMFV